MAYLIAPCESTSSRTEEQPQAGDLENESGMVELRMQPLAQCIIKFIEHIPMEPAAGFDI